LIVSKALLLTLKFLTAQLYLNFSSCVFAYILLYLELLLQDISWSSYSQIPNVGLIPLIDCNCLQLDNALNAF